MMFSKLDEQWMMLMSAVLNGQHRETPTLADQAGGLLLPPTQLLQSFFPGSSC